MNPNYLRYSTVVLAIILIIGETIVLLNTDKYWPLSVDDYIAASCLIISAYLSTDFKYWPFMIASWAFVLGNMYAMLFSRLDPIYGSGERIMLLVVINLISCLYLVLSIRTWMNHKSS